MLVPGSNVLNLAFRLIAKQVFFYYKFQSRTPNAMGDDITAYYPAKPIQGSVQPLPRNLYQSYGLDFQRHYVHFFVPQNVIDIGRDVSGDQMKYNGQVYQCISDTPWHQIDGWTQVLAVQVNV